MAALNVFKTVVADVTTALVLLVAVTTNDVAAAPISAGVYVTVTSDVERVESPVEAAVLGSVGRATLVVPDENNPCAIMQSRFRR